MTGVLDLVPAILPWANSALFNPPNPVATSGAPSQNVLRLSPVYIPNRVRLTGIIVETTVAGEAGSLIRCGIYATALNGCPSGQSLNGASGVTVAADSAPGFLEAACNVVLPPGWYAGGGQLELAPTTQPTIRTVTSAPYTYPIASASSNAAGWSYTAQTPGTLATLSGAIPAASSIAYRVIYRTGVL